jgi:hypothetical protein
MTIKEFNEFCISKKSDTVWEWGYFITSTKKDGLNTLVFSLEDFFVEVIVSLNKGNTISIQAVTESSDTKRYTEQVKKDHFILNVMLNERAIMPSLAIA